jgi:pimeloyl-ACP methyl ester carboxylesterase
MRPICPLAYTRTGSGEPLVLLHGLGSSGRAWDPVIPLLAETFDVIVVDLPGFGASAPFGADAEPHPAAIAALVAMTLSDLAVESPHLAGNSLGGWVALELAAVMPVASITLLSPAGLWRDHTPVYCRISLATMRVLARFGGPLLRALAPSGAARWVMFRLIVGRPGQMSATVARQAIIDLGRARGFRATLRATRHRAYVGQDPIEAPVSVSFGTRDLLLPRQARHRDRLPGHTRVLPVAGTGHVPMTDDPRAVAALIDGTAHPQGVGGSPAPASR